MIRLAWAMLGCAASLGAVVSVAIHLKPRLIWNASASVPIGLYAVRPAGALQVGELVVISPPEPLATFLDARGYLPKGVPLLKHILALPGRIVCRSGNTITVDGIAMGEALEHDRRGRPLPVWQGCNRVTAGEVFVMNPQRQDSVDGRYFGVLPATAIVGRADLLWAKGR